MRVPANTIEIKYTSGDEFVFSFNYKFYQGHYYEFNDKFFAGKEFNIYASELVKANSKEINTSLTNPKTFIYGSFTKIPPKSSPKLISIAKTDLDVDTEGVETYYAKKINVNPPAIKEIDKKTFDQLQQDPFYQVISLKPDRSNLDQADQQMPGLKTWLLG